MAFILPLTILGSSLGGFAAGYYYMKPYDNDKDNNGGEEGGKKANIYENKSNSLSKNYVREIKNISKDIKEIANNNPYTQMHDEITSFKKDSLKKINKENCMKKLTAEQELLENLRKKMIKRRISTENDVL